MRRHTIVSLVAVFVVGVAAACGAAASPSPMPATASPVASSPAAEPSHPSPAVTPVPGGSLGASSAAPPPAASPTTQTDTEWGRIWDALPSWFPVPPAASPAQADEAVSALFDVPGSVDEVAEFMQPGLERIRLSTIAQSGPLEDGSIVIDSEDPAAPGCQVQTTIAPAGGLTRMTVRYGADCPFG